MESKRSERWRNSKYVVSIILLLALVEMAMIFVGTYVQSNSSKNLQQAYNNQLKYRTLAMELKDSSDYLTNEVREFAVTGDMEYFRNYWNEARHQMNRERIIQEIEQADIPDEEERDLERAKYFSDTIMHIEISSMRLVLEAKGIMVEDEPDEFLKEWISYVKNYPLEEDYRCEENEKFQKASIILYGNAYDTYKELIDRYVNEFQISMNERLDETVEIARKESKRAFFLQIFFGIGELAVLAVILLLFDTWYINPIIRYKKPIERQHGRRKMFVVPEGVWELQQFAEEFNALSADMLNELAKSDKIEQELMEAKANAEKANQVKSQFLTQMSHELRTPLNTISGYLFLLEDTKMSGEQRRYTENMHQATDILLEEINEILDYSKLESGKMVFENRSFSLRNLVENLQSILENEAEQRNLYFKIDIDEHIPDYVCGDPLKLKQVLTNLVYNGFKFTKEGGVSLTIQGLCFQKTICVLEFVVEDTGIGIKKEQKQEIFQAFSQADESITRKYGGTGLGLPICRKIVEEMSHGKYTLLLDSEEGKGSKFYFDMEFAYGKEEQEKASEPKKKQQNKRKLSILIVDDNRVNLILEAELLHKLGFLADVELDAQKVIPRLQEKSYDIVFLDISMPGISGYELSEQIRKRKEWKNLILVALTANIGEEVRRKVEEAKMDAYLPKPIPMEELAALLEKYTDQVMMVKQEKELPEENGLVAFQQLEKQFYGDKNAVKELFEIFVEDNADLEPKIRQAAAKEDWENLELEIHRIKGVSGNLLCRSLEREAAACFEDVKKKKLSSIHMEQLFSVFSQTMKDIEEYQKKE